MAKSQYKIQDCETLKKSSFVDYLSETDSFKHETNQRLSKWASIFFSWMADSIGSGKSISLKPTGHLVVSRREEKELYLPDSRKLTVEAGHGVRFRRLSSAGDTIRRQGALTELQPLMPDASTKQVESFFVGFKSYIVFALANRCRIEIRGLGAFNLHEKPAIPIYNSGIKKTTSAKAKRYFNFTPSKNISEQLKHLT
jgi:nucleoid DNA-binding protein